MATLAHARLRRINHTLSLLGPEARRGTALRPIELLVIAPSQRLDDIAGRHLLALPVAVRAMLRGIGVTAEGDRGDSQVSGGAALASYLLFEAPYTRELIALGESDTLGRRDEVRRFFRWDGAAAAAPPS